MIISFIDGTGNIRNYNSLAEVPGVVGGIFKKSNFERKKFRFLKKKMSMLPPG